MTNVKQCDGKTERKEERERERESGREESHVQPKSMPSERWGRLGKTAT